VKFEGVYQLPFVIRCAALRRANGTTYRKGKYLKILRAKEWRQLSHPELIEKYFALIFCIISCFSAMHIQQQREGKDNVVVHPEFATSPYVPGIDLIASFIGALSLHALHRSCKVSRGNLAEHS
jgi:hypothetical protein